jgi:hypothetical protein
LCAQGHAAAQANSDSYLDEGARALVQLARQRRLANLRIAAYTTTARERESVGLQAGLGEKLLYRRERVTRIAWERNGPVHIDLVGVREVTPVIKAEAQVPSDITADLPTMVFDPAGGNLPALSDSGMVRHPLSDRGEQHYRFASGDTTEIRLPDGRTVRLIELRITPRRSDPQLVSGSLWLEAQTHSVVRAYFKLARAFDSQRDRLDVPVAQSDADNITVNNLPAFLGSVRFNVEVMALEYGLWDLQWWLPRVSALEGFVQLGGVRVPFKVEHSYGAYTVRVDSIAPQQPDALPRRCRGNFWYTSTASTTDSLRQARADSARVFRERLARRSAEARGDTTRIDCQRDFMVTAAGDSALLHSEELPASIYASEAEVMTPSDLRALETRVRDLPGAPWRFTARRFQWGWRGVGLLRFNRVEALSAGLRQSFDLGVATLDAEARLGVADREPRGEVVLDRRGDALDTRFALYRRLQPTTSAPAHGTIASLSALLFGRDDLDYFDTLGGELIWQPADSRTQWLDLRLYAERQRAVERNSGFSLAHAIDGDNDVRNNFSADAADQLGVRVRLRGALGVNPARPRLAGELLLAGETGDFRLLRPELLLRAETPLPFRLALRLEGAAGSTEGDSIPAQALWRLGGAATLRGYAGSTLVAERYWRTRAELGLGIPGARVSVFSDAGWAGPRNRFDSAGTRFSGGVGGSFFDGLLRVDLAHGFNRPNDWRLHVNLNAQR